LKWAVIDVSKKSIISLSKHLWNVGRILLDYTTQHPSIQSSPNVVVEWLTPCFVFHRYLVQISDRRPTMLTEVVRGFSQSPNRIPGWYLKFGHDSFPQNPFQIIIHISQYDCTLWVVLVTEKRRKINLK
jgi:hypothetical protein